MLSQSAFAATPTLRDFAHTAWNGQRGAPSDVLQFAQTKDGWLWISTSNGFFRFDGVDFERMDRIRGHRLHTTSTVGLLATRDGRLWVGGRFGGISMFADGNMQVFTEAQGLPKGMVLTMTEGPDGSVWVATSSGVAVLQPDAKRFRRVGRQEGLPETFARQVLFGRDGRQWIAVQGGIWYRDPGQPRYHRAWPYLDLMAMAEAPDGTLWGSDGIDKHYRVLTRAPRGNPVPRAELGGNGALFDRAGNMWILKVDALELRRPPYVGPNAEVQQLRRETGLSGPLPQTVFQDREGNMWIGTSAGLDRLRRGRIQNVPVPTAFDRPGVIADDGGAIISDWRTPLQLYDLHGPKKVLGQMHFNAAYRAPDGSLWLADSVARWTRSTSAEPFRRIPHPPHLRGYAPQAMTIDGKGRMWISLSRGGLFVIDNGTWLKQDGVRGVPDVLALSLATDSAGQVWAGFLNHQIVRFEDRQITAFGQADGLQIGSVLSLLVQGDHVWAGGADGMAWYDGRRWHPISGIDGQPLRGVSGMARTPDGELWLHGADGISRVAAVDVARMPREANGRLAYERFNGLDGLVGTAEQLRPLPSISQGSDGRLWFATGSEVATLQPAAIVRNPVAPPVQVLSLQAGNVSHDATQDVRLLLGQRDVRIAFTALGLAVPERLRFRYKLEGFDERWQDVGARREAVYTNLPPGKYTFRVTAANEDGVWNDKGAVLRLMVPPRFVETAWFATLLCLAAGLLLWGLYLLRVRRLTARLRERMQARSDERERIARGLHDTLLQSVQGLIMLVDQQVRKLPISAEDRSKIDETLDFADVLVAEGRDCLLDLRTDSDGGELDLTLGQFGGVLLQDRFASSMLGTARPLAATVRAEVKAIAREALSNAARHAGASKVELIIDYRPDAFILVVRDNGCGIPVALQDGGGPPKHYGIIGMRERAKTLGARYRLDSVPGVGTTLQLEIDAALAYPGHRSASLFAQLRQRRGVRTNAA